uniref:hypothetical protein n=1 Tax=Serratia proteamaculans TaxID=28151 RepID=UPI001F4C318D|nr:hypothetical protein [Serratia proteamaculans]ULG16488.1 hypothetical protein 1137p_00090 [Serratia proteamaculans]
MTDKTTQNKEETPPALTKTTDTVRDSEPKSRALHQADSLKERFKAGSIPLQTDFADLIDLANIGRKAVGDEGTAWGLTQDNKGRLQLDTSRVFNTVVDLSSNSIHFALPKNILGKDPVTYNYALVVKDAKTGPVNVINSSDVDFTIFNVHALKRKNGNSEYVTLKVIGKKRSGINLGDYPLEMVKNNLSDKWSIYCQFSLDTSSEDYSDSLLFIEPLALEVHHVPDFSNDSIGEVVGMLNIHFQYATAAGKGMKRSGTGQLELNAGSGLNVDGNGVSVKVGNGVAIDSGGVTIKAGDGVTVNNSGVTIKAGQGIIVREGGVSIKTGGGIKVDEGGVSIKQGGGFLISGDGKLHVNAGNGIKLGSNGVEVKAGNGIHSNGNGLHIKLAKGKYTNGGEGQGNDGQIDGSAGGLNLTSKGLSVDAGEGIQINGFGVSIKLATNSGLRVDENNGLCVQMYGRGMVMMFVGTANEVPEGWALCDGNNGTPKLLERSIIKDKNDGWNETGGISFIMKL